MVGGIVHRWSGDFASDDEVNFSPRTGEQGMTRVKNPFLGDDASERLVGLSRDGERHPVCLEGAPADEDGVGISPEFQQPGVIGAGGPAGWAWG